MGETNWTLSEAFDDLIRPSTEADYEKGVQLEFYEYDCGVPCTPSGCPGHGSEVPVSIIVNGIRLVVAGSVEGDFPGSDQLQVQKTVETLNWMHDVLSRELEK